MIHTRRPLSSLLYISAIVSLLCDLAAVALAAELPDICEVPIDKSPPVMIVASPAAGKRVRQVVSEYQETEVYHSLYLPTDWEKGMSFPVIVEYAGNGPFHNEYGDICTGKVEDCNLGYGISGGESFIWVCLPYISADHQHNQLRWWGDVPATVDYCQKIVRDVCENYGGDQSAVFLAGFSRGSIACNFIGLQNDQIASLWRGFVCHSHYDGVRKWDYSEATGQSAESRLKRLAGRPQFISHEGSVEETRNYLAKTYPSGNFTFQTLPYRNHTDIWVLRDIPERQALRKWMSGVLKRDLWSAGE